MSQSTLTTLTFVVGTLIVLLLYLKARNTPREVPELKKHTMDSMFEVVKLKMTEFAHEESIYGVDHEAFNAAWQRQHRFSEAMVRCSYGFDADKLLVKDMIARILRKELPTLELIYDIIDLESPYLDSQVKWEILMGELKKPQGKNAFGYIMKKYNLDCDKYVSEGETDPMYVITHEDIDFVYASEGIQMSYTLAIETLSTLFYIKWKGFGCVDTLQELNIDGINGGVSGSVLYAVLGKRPALKFTRSVWVQFEGKYIHLRFLSFETEDEMRRICTLLGRYRKPGPLTERKPVQLTTMANQSRLLVMRPSASDSWAFFIRKFTLSNKTLEFLWNPMIDVEVPDEEVIPDDRAAV